MNRISSLAVLFLITGCGGGGGGGGGDTPAPPPTPAPGISFSATPTSVLLNNTSTFSWSTTNATSCTASGSNNWTGTKATSGTEDVSIHIAGNTAFTLSCSGGGGTRNASVTVEGYRQTDGVVVDGYISGADVFIDENANFIADGTENSTTSDNDGKFTIKYANGSLVSIGGTDLDSQTLLDNLLITHKLDGYSDFKAITPVTSVDAFLESVDVNAALGIDSSINIAVDDPVALKGDGGIYDFLYEKGNQLTVLAYALQNITNDLNTTTETTQDFFKSIAEEVETEYTQTQVKVDIETEAFIAKALDNVINIKSLNIEETAKQNTLKALSGVLPIIEVKSSDDLTTSVIRFGVATLQEDIKAIANGTADEDKVESYTTDVIKYIAEDQGISSDEITPDITAIDDNSSIDEDTSIIINVLANDSFITTSPISIDASNGDNGTVGVTKSSPPQITYSPNSDYFGNDLFSYTITQGDKTSSAEVEVDINPINDAPSIDIASTLSIPENQTAITTVSVSDPDEDDLTLTLRGEDANSLNLTSENVLSFKEESDFETKAAYSINLFLTDGEETVDKDISIVITNVNDIAPVFTSEATFSVAENQTAIGTVTATDAEGDDVTFTVSGDELAITSAGVLTFVSEPDFETKTSYTATVTATDGTNPTTQDITINITNVNDIAPEFTSEATFTAAENQTEIGTVTATDAEGDDVTFTVSGNELAITSAGALSFISAPDYETKTSYTATVTATDGTNPTTQDIALNITDINEAPEIILIVDALGNQNSDAIFDKDELPNNSSITGLGPKLLGTVYISDPDDPIDDATLENLIVTLSNTDDFEIDLGEYQQGGPLQSFGHTLMATLKLREYPDYEANSSLTTNIIVSDGVNSTVKEFIVNIQDMNDAPVITSNSSLNTDENQLIAVQVNASDQDNDTLTYALTGDDASMLSINSTGLISFIDKPNYEIKNIYNTSVTVSDGKLGVNQNIVININDLNDAPTIGISSVNSHPENAILVGNINATDEDGDTLSTSISGGEDRSLFSLSSDGILSFISAPNYEKPSDADNDNIYNLELTVTDGGLITSKNITLQVNDINDAPTIYDFFPSNFYLYENGSYAETVSGTDCRLSPYINFVTCGNLAVVTIDGDSKNSVRDEDNNPLTYSITGEDAEYINVTQNSFRHGGGAISLKDNADYETKDVYRFTFNVSDGEYTTSKDAQINILNVDEQPVLISPTNISLDENTEKVLSIVAEDPEGQSISYRMGASNQGNSTRFNITSDGVLTLKEYAQDYEGYPSSVAYVYIEDDGNTRGATQFTVTLNNLNDNIPQITSEATFSADENQTAIGQIITSDADGSILAYSISGDDISIDAVTGVLLFNEPPDYETTQSYSALITVSDEDFETTQTITVNINNLNDNAPVFTTEITEVSIEENDGKKLPSETPSKYVMTITATDADGDSLWFSIPSESNLNNIFQIGNESGEIKCFSNTCDYEETSSITGNVNVYDGSFNAQQEVTIKLININDNNPTITSSCVSKYLDSGDKCYIPENTTDLVFYEYQVSDPDGDLNDLIVEPQVRGSGVDYTYWNIDRVNKTLSLKASPDYESPPFPLGDIIGIRLFVTDGLNTSWDDGYTDVLITGVNEFKHELISPTTFNVIEGEDQFGPISITDADDGDRVTVCLDGDDSEYFWIEKTGFYNEDSVCDVGQGTIRWKNSLGYLPDYESDKTQYRFKLIVKDIGDSEDGIGSKTFSQVYDYTINIVDRDDTAPSITSPNSFTVAENSGYVVGTITATDVDTNDSEIIFSLHSTGEANDNDLFSVIRSTGIINFRTMPDYEDRSSYNIDVYAGDRNGNGSTQNIEITVTDVDELSTANDCNYIVNDASTGEFRYCWEEAQTTSGTEYSANIVEPLTVTFADESLEIPNISYAEKLYVEYGIILESDSIDWTNDQAYAIHQILKKIPQNVRNENVDGRIFSKWTLTDLQIQDDISFDKEEANIEVTLESSVFDNANPRVASIDGKKGIYFSNKLHNALVRYVTDNGNDAEKVNKILVDRYGVTTTIDDYLSLTGEQATRFQAFQADELIAIIAMFEEMPSGYHKIEGLDYLVRRINGAENPYYPEAPAIAWDGSGYIEFMEKAFNTFSIDYLHRLILHEKAHFLWAKIFDDDLKNEWIELGGWYECTEKESGWCTTKQTEFVSAYAHLKNPNEDMAESLSFFVINPDALKSRSMAKYEFVRDRIMQGNIYISLIQENLTFKVYNLYPDYVFPGKVKKLFVSVEGDPTEDKTVTVEIQLHALDKILEGAAWARMRIFSTADTYFDLYLNPQNGQSLDTTLRGTFTLSKYAKSGYWKTSQLVLSDEVGNLRMEGANDFGWRMYVNNPNEDIDKPLYVDNSMALTKSLTTIENQEVDVITALWDINEAFPRENKGCYGALNDENSSTYSIERYSPETYSGNYVAGKCMLEYLMPSYMPSGTYRLNYIKMFDEAGNESRNYFATPTGVDTGDFNDGDKIDELAKEVYLETTNPDTTPPELDLNSLSITATPTNPDNPNGETIVEFTFRVKDDISGYKLGYYTFRDPQGLTSAYYHYPERRDEIFPSAEDLDWYEYTSTVTLPAGSAPGTWGVVELTLRDRALNFKTYNFTEIISFQTE